MRFLVTEEDAIEDAEIKRTKLKEDEEDEEENF